MILHGSLTLDDYVPGRSDVDLLLVVDPPSDARLAALAEAMASRRAEAPGPVDLRLVIRQVAASPTPATPLEAYLRLTPGPGSVGGAPAPRGERDLAPAPRRRRRRLVVVSDGKPGDRAAEEALTLQVTCPLLSVVVPHQPSDHRPQTDQSGLSSMSDPVTRPPLYPLVSS